MSVSCLLDSPSATEQSLLLGLSVHVPTAPLLSDTTFTVLTSHWPFLYLPTLGLSFCLWGLA